MVWQLIVTSSLQVLSKFDGEADGDRELAFDGLHDNRR